MKALAWSGPSGGGGGTSGGDGCSSTRGGGDNGRGGCGPGGVGGAGLGGLGLGKSRSAQCKKGICACQNGATAVDDGFNDENIGSSTTNTPHHT